MTLLTFIYVFSSDLAYFEYIQDTITQVQLVYPKSQYIDPKYHFILVVVTSTEILLFGIEFANQDGVALMRGNGSTNYEDYDMTIWQEPLYRVC